MRKLDRTAVPAPSCLAEYYRQHKRWDDVMSEDKRPIREALGSMQNDLCAYCEGPLRDDAHIEHFRRRHDAPQLTFAWKNLFLSCNEPTHCGHHKDRSGSPYDPADLVKPDEDDPDEFLFFSSAGDVRPRSGIDEAKRRRAEETIRVFNLNHGALRALRRRALAVYQGLEPDILGALEAFEATDREQLIAAEIAATAHDPYGASIRHFFERV